MKLDSIVDKTDKLLTFCGQKGGKKKRRKLAGKKGSISKPH